MRKAALLYNPDSGGSKQRQRELESALALLRAGGVEADLIPTQSPYHAVEETRGAIDSGCDTIFACGGDGTIHNIVQVLANSPIALAMSVPCLNTSFNRAAPWMLLLSTWSMPVRFFTPCAGPRNRRCNS